MICDMNKTILFLTLSLFLVWQSCNNSVEENPPQTAALSAKQSSLISNYPSSLIGVEDKIIINFQKPFEKADSHDSYLTFSPKIQGELKRSGSRKVIFTPSAELKRGQNYRATLDLNALYENLEANDQILNFDFAIKKQHLTLNHGPLKMDDPIKGSYSISGSVRTEDAADLEDVKSCISVTHENVLLHWKQGRNSRLFEFSISGIKRSEKEQEIRIAYDGNGIDAKEAKGESKILIPAIGDFKVMEASLDKENSQNINITFSELLDPAQDLTGLIRIRDYDGKLSTQIDNNILTLYTNGKLIGVQTIWIEQELKNRTGQTLQSSAQYEVTFTSPDPSVELVGQGVICPNQTGMIFPFRAIKLRAIDLEIFKIYDNNILQYFQSNYYDSEYGVNNTVGRIVLQTAVDLSQLNPDASYDHWTSYGLDLTEMIKMDPGALYQVRISFRKEYAITDCLDANNEPLDLEINQFDENKDYTALYDYYGYGGYYSGFYQDQDNACKDAYYARDRFVKRNIYASNVGMIAKKGATGSLFLACNDLVNGAPLSNVKVDLLDYQKQLIKTVTTQEDGTLMSTVLDRDPYFAIAYHDQQKGILALNDSWSLSLSNFDVSGDISQKGIKGQFYTERGVYRPGDDIYLNFVLEDKLNTLPDNYPAKLIFTDPQGKEVSQITSIQNVEGIYPFVLSTIADAPTGNYYAELTVGASSFTKRIKVETIKPNRLKIRFSGSEKTISASEKGFQSEMAIKWLVGTIAKNVKAKVDMQIKEGDSNFASQRGYHFYDLTRKYSGDAQVIFDGNVNDKGLADINYPLKENDNFPGMMKLSIQTKAFEPGGDFSIDNFTKPYSPYEHYVGIKLPKTDYGADRLNRGEENRIQFVSVDESGSSISNRKLTGAVYKLQWRWWWDRQSRGLSQYNTSNYSQSIETFELNTTKDGATYSFTPRDWGRYLIRVCDEQSGHCSSKISYAGYPYGSDGDDDFATILTLSSDEQEYQTGDQVTLKFPSAEGGRALISIENGADILQTQWVNTTAKQTEYKFTIGESMAPTIYANVSYMQAQVNANNDKPIRMYGVIPLSVYDPQTKLNPAIKTAASFAPEEPVRIQVSELNGKEMAYTLAVVDEGLLDLTRFKTPNLWNKFYTREALGVKTWDLYDYVMGSLSGQIDRVISVGGDEDLKPKDKKNKANRFEPVVQHFGPFFLKSGNKKTHEFVMPNYIGSVRVMVVAAHEGAYGKAEETKPVKKPLMVLSSLPRVLSPGERLQVPISVFALEDKIKNVKITVEDQSGLIAFPKGNSTRLTFSEIGEEMAYIDIAIPEAIGVARFNIVAESAGERASQQVEIQVDNPNEFVSAVDGTILKAGETWTQKVAPIGMMQTNSGVLQVSNVPPINLEKRLGYILRYPHGCLEQTISRAFPLLYLDRFVELSEEQKKDRLFYIDEALNKISSYAGSNGAFLYWPGSYINLWSNNYAGHFLLEAEKAGFAVPQQLLNKWISFQSNAANKYTHSIKNYADNDLTQAYRLYTLALAGDTKLGAMNRLRQRDDLSTQAKWRLAAAYAIDSRPEIAREIIAALPIQSDYNKVQMADNFRSNLRDAGMILETLSLIDDSKEKAFKLMYTMGQQLESQSYHNTQAISFALIAIGKFLSEKQSDKFSFQYQLDQQNTELATDKSMISLEVDTEVHSGQEMTVKNTSEDDLFVRFTNTGKPVQGDANVVQDGITMTIDYMDQTGAKVDLAHVNQSQDIISKITVKHGLSRAGTIRNLALTQALPSGWEIINDRMTDVENKYKSSASDYQDIRDDRIHTYFDLEQGSSKVFYTRMTATYKGNYYLPNQVCKAMYDEAIQATIPGQMIDIKKQNL
jgi:uncharacterized protein YfaS (alpha-2-macroglobulin family)